MSCMVEVLLDLLCARLEVVVFKLVRGGRRERMERLRGLKLGSRR